MKIREGSSTISADLRSPIVTIGNFDGVHIGHQRIFQVVTARARELDGTSVCYTFRPHPQKIIAPDRCPPLLVTHRKKLRLIEQSGIDFLVIEQFTPSFSQQTAAQFMKNVLYDLIRPVEVYVGHDFHFGKGREASFSTLQEMGERLGIRVAVIEEVVADGAEVSSSRIRQLVAAGAVEEVSRLLGRAFTVEGPVVPGAARGRGMGFATANIEAENELIPADGVYAVFGRRGGATVEEEGDLMPGVANVGYAPTFGRKQRAVEVHFLDLEDDGEWSRLEVLFLARIREERKFANAGALVDQIRKDVEVARAVHAEQAWRIGVE